MYFQHENKHSGSAQMKHYTPIYGHLQFFLIGSAECCVNLVRIISG